MTVTTAVYSKRGEGKGVQCWRGEEVVITGWSPSITVSDEGVRWSRGWKTSVTPSGGKKEDDNQVDQCLSPWVVKGWDDHQVDHSLSPSAVKKVVITRLITVCHFEWCRGWVITRLTIICHWQWWRCGGVCQVAQHLSLEVVNVRRWSPGWLMSVSASGEWGGNCQIDHRLSLELVKKWSDHKVDHRLSLGLKEWGDRQVDHHFSLVVVKE